MLERRFATLDVFTDTPLAGNPLAVVLDADLKVRDVFAKGRTMVREATVVVKGVFEK